MSRGLFLVAACASAAAIVALPVPAGAQATPSTSRSAYEARTVQDLAALCGASPQAPDYASALAFCHGFLQGAGQYHAAVTQPGSGHAPLFCPPDPPPTRAQVANAFVAWARANPAAADERAVDGLARWARASYPCPETDRTARQRIR